MISRVLFKIYFLIGCILIFSIVLNGQQPKLLLPVGHAGPINAVDFSPHKNIIATASDDNTAKVWDGNTGFLLLDLKGHTKSVTDVHFSTDGNKVITASNDNSAKLWNCNTGNLLYSFVHESAISSAQFNMGGTKIVTASYDKKSKIWDAETGSLLFTLTGHSGYIYLAKFSPNGKLIASVSADSTCKIWDTETGNLVFNLRGHQGDVTFFDFNYDGSKLVTASADKNCFIWDLRNGKLVNTFKGHKDQVSTAVFNPKGDQFVSSSADGYCIIWNAISGKELKVLGSHTDIVNTAVFNKSGSLIVTASWDHTCKVWNSFTGELLYDFDRNNFHNINLAIFTDTEHPRVITATNEGKAEVWSLANGKLLFELKSYVPQVENINFSSGGEKILTRTLHATYIWDNAKPTNLALWDASGNFRASIFSPDGKKIITTSADTIVRMYDAETGKVLKEMKGHTDAITDLVYSLDGKYIVTSSFDGTVRLWNSESGKTVRILHGHTDYIYSIRFNLDGTKIITASLDNTARIWDVQTGNVLKLLKGHSDFLFHAEFSPDGTRAVTASNDQTAIVWDVNTGKILTKVKEKTGVLVFAQLSPDNKQLLTYDNSDVLRIWDILSGKSLKLMTKPFEFVGSAEFSHDGEKIIAALNNEVKVWESSSFKLLYTLKGHGSVVTVAKISPDGKTILTTSTDKTCKQWSVVDGTLLRTFFPIDSNEHFIQLPSGYYQSSPKATKLLHYVTKDLKVITFEQLDVKYNRPDKVLEGIGNSDTALIKSYRKAYEKRIKKLGIDTTAFREGYSVLEADFANRDAIEYEQKTGILKLIIKANDSTYKLDRFNVWVNETPLFGQRGINIRKRNKNDFDTTIIVKLSQGENRIETSITNVNGTESYRMPLLLNYTPAVKEKEMTRFIGIGIDKFSDSQYNLEYSSKDIRDLAKKLKEKYKDDIIIDTLFNENVTVSNVKALKQKLQQTSVNDKVIISYSGHGLLSKDYDYYLSTYAVNFQKPEENGLAYDELENLLDSIPARKKLMLIDACHSGEVDKEEGIAMQRMADSLGLKKGIILDDSTTQTQQLGLQNSFELMQSLFVNVGKSTGATIISAAAGNQFALERGDLKNGVFTYSILEAMEKNKTMKISELKKIVGERVEQLTNGMQKPTSRNETIAVDWDIW